MPRHYVPTAVSSPRLLASAIGVAITATSASQMAHAADPVPASENVVSLDATSIEGVQDETSYKTDTATSKKYTAPLRETPKSVTVIPNRLSATLAPPAW